MTPPYHIVYKSHWGGVAPLSGKEGVYWELNDAKRYFAQECQGSAHSYVICDHDGVIVQVGDGSSWSGIPQSDIRTAVKDVVAPPTRSGAELTPPFFIIYRSNMPGSGHFVNEDMSFDTKKLAEEYYARYCHNQAHAYCVCDARGCVIRSGDSWSTFDEGCCSAAVRPFLGRANKPRDEDTCWMAFTLNNLQTLTEKNVALHGSAASAKAMWEVVNAIVRPECAASQKPYAWVLNRGHLEKCEVFISHAWAECFEEFCESIRSVRGRIGPDPKLWICAFALWQPPTREQSAEVAKQLGDDPLQAPFTTALRSSRTFLVVRNANLDMYSRVWCVWEIFLAETLGKTGPESLVIAGRNPPSYRPEAPVDVRSCESSVPADKTKIMDYITNDMDRSGSMVHKVNDCVMRIKRM
eukprot:NODE_8234_length_1512_cov_5.241877.p1 GENE.NODE_8234_length_1512_cov_5.241877~~NODE_8234_length_1512_cov_5.241877.p1  ORF type:complete len:410 (-),score=75.62 NODE_8234_length_1512_cov_5.241877:241-1470(-)